MNLRVMADPVIWETEKGWETAGGLEKGN